MIQGLLSGVSREFGETGWKGRVRCVCFGFERGELRVPVQVPVQAR